jgi:hypothetical protein
VNVWESRSGGMYCAAHERLFGALETCADCDRAPGEAPAVEHAEDIDKETCISMSECTRVAKMLRRLGEEMCTAGTPKDKVNAMKIFETSLKHERAAMETRQRILDREHDRWLVEQNRKLQGGSD